MRSLAHSGLCSRAAIFAPLCFAFVRNVMPFVTTKSVLG